MRQEAQKTDAPAMVLHRRGNQMGKSLWSLPLQLILRHKPGTVKIGSAQSSQYVSSFGNLEAGL